MAEYYTVIENLPMPAPTRVGRPPTLPVKRMAVGDAFISPRKIDVGRISNTERTFVCRRLANSEDGQKQYGIWRIR